MNNSFYTVPELEQLGFRSLGENVLISRFARFYSPGDMEIGNSVRIDDFCILSGTIKLGNYIHISAFCALYGKFGIEMEDFTGLSPRCTVFSASDDFSGNYLVGPMVEDQLTNVTGGKILMRKYSQLGSGCIVLPGLEIGEGVAVGAMSLVIESLNDWGIFKGIPARYHKERSKELLKYINHD